MARRELYRIWNLHDRIISYYTIKFGIILIAYYIDDNDTGGDPAETAVG